MDCILHNSRLGAALTKSASTIIVEFTSPEDANEIIDEGLIWQGEVFQCERYDRQCRLKQCYKCQKYGHMRTQCKANTACGYCAAGHDSKDCPTKIDKSLEHTGILKATFFPTLQSQTSRISTELNIKTRFRSIAAAQIAPHVTSIFNWSLRPAYCPAHFRNSTTIVLRKPGKDNYTIPKAYRPIGLLSTIGKLMDSIVAKRISYVTEAYKMLPDTHVGGRKGRSNRPRAAYHYRKDI